MRGVRIGARIEDLRKHRKIKSQSALARAAGMKQSTLNGLINSDYRWSPHLPAIARALQTTVEYLIGDTNDPDANIPPAPPPADVQLVTMTIALPGEQYLARMFDAMLELLDELPDKPDRDERARLLARWLPTGLSQLRDLLPDPGPPLPPAEKKELAEALSTAGRGSRS